MILIAGLGNPGEEYCQTRHNIGFDIIDTMQTRFNFPPYSKKFNSCYSHKNIFNKKVIIQKPMNYMNLSGESIKKIINFFKITDSQNIIVFHDDLDLAFSKIRIKQDGGHGGHNGIRNIINLIGSDFIRFKLGIKNEIYEKGNISAEKFVLSKFNDTELKKNEVLKNKIMDNFEYIIKKDFLFLRNDI